jgi:hypothetical protein
MGDDPAAGWIAAIIIGGTAGWLAWALARFAPSLASKTVKGDPGHDPAQAVHHADVGELVQNPVVHEAEDLIQQLAGKLGHGIRERAMPLSKVTVSAPLPIERPTCPKCSSFMWLARTMPDVPGCDQRTFECARCGHEIIRIYPARI